MRVIGERIRKTRLIHTDRYVIAVDVEAVIPIDDPSEPCYEPETIQLLKKIKELAESGDEQELKRYGKVYVAAEVA